MRHPFASISSFLRVCVTTLSLAAALLLIGCSVASAQVSTQADSVAYQKIESLLDQPLQAQLDTDLTAEELIELLRDLGIPAVLSESAKEDLLTEDDVIPKSCFGTPDQSLRNRLTMALQRFNATLALRDGSLNIISLDNAWDEEYQYVVIYDLSHIAMSPNSLVEVIHRNIHADSWSDSQGLGEISLVRIGNRWKIVVTQSYEVHQSISRFLISVRGQASRVCTVHASESLRPLRQPEVAQGPIKYVTPLRSHRSLPNRSRPPRHFSRSVGKRSTNDDLAIDVIVGN